MKRIPWFLLLFNVGRIFWKKLRYRPRFRTHPIQRISPRASLELHGQGQMNLGYNLCVSPLCCFQALSSGLLEIGDKVFFNRGCIISCHQKVTIGKGCVFGPDVKIYDNDHSFSKEGIDLSAHKLGDISVGEGTWVAANVVILRNTHIGKHCVIGAGAVVKGTIPDHSLVTTDRTLIISPIE